VLHGKLSVRVKELAVRFLASADVVAVYALRPAVAKLLFQRPAGEIEPASVEKSAEFIRAGHPDHDRSRVGHGAKTFLALAYGLLASFALGNVKHKAAQLQWRASLRATIDDVVHPDDLP